LFGFQCSYLRAALPVISAVAGSLFFMLTGACRGSPEIAEVLHDAFD